MNKKNRKYTIIPHNPQWPTLFSEESKRINGLFGDEIIESYHVGSTSVPGMAGKPTVDMLFVVKDISNVDKYISEMQDIGYISRGACNDEYSHLFEREVEGERIFISHFYQKDHLEIEKILGLRDYLRANKNIAHAYSEFKISLSKRFPFDYDQYRKRKDEYMKNLKNTFSR